MEMDGSIEIELQVFDPGSSIRSARLAGYIFTFLPVALSTVVLVSIRRAASLNPFSH